MKRLRDVFVGAMGILASSLSACSAHSATDTPLIESPSPRWDDSPVQTDSLLYHLKRGAGEYRAYVKATYTNRTTDTVYFPRCYPGDTAPRFSVRRTGTDSTVKFFTDVVWACTGGAPTGALAPGAVVTMRVPVGSIDQMNANPPITPEQLVGLLRINLRLCVNYTEEPNHCTTAPAAAGESNAFRVSY